MPSVAAGGMGAIGEACKLGPHQLPPRSSPAPSLLPWPPKTSITWGEGSRWVYHPAWVCFLGTRSAKAGCLGDSWE